MKTIKVARAHDLSHAEAKQAAERLATDLGKRFGLAWNWDGDDVHFARPGVSGVMHVGDTKIVLEVRLGLLFAPLRPSIEKEIRARLDALTGKRTA